MLDLRLGAHCDPKTAPLKLSFGSSGLCRRLAQPSPGNGFQQLFSPSNSGVAFQPWMFCSLSARIVLLTAPRQDRTKVQRYRYGIDRIGIDCTNVIPSTEEKGRLKKKYLRDSQGTWMSWLAPHIYSCLLSGFRLTTPSASSSKVWRNCAWLGLVKGIVECFILVMWKNRFTGLKSKGSEFIFLVWDFAMKNPKLWAFRRRHQIWQGKAKQNILSMSGFPH